MPAFAVACDVAEPLVLARECRQEKDQESDGGAMNTSGGRQFMPLAGFCEGSPAGRISNSVSCGRNGTVNYHPLLSLKCFKGFGV